MKRTGKMHSLRGSGTVNLSNGFTGGNEILLFSYSSPDQTRGWILKDAWVWLNLVDGTGGGDTRVGVQSCLSTDFISPNKGGTLQNVLDYLSQYSPADNRTIAWSTQDYLRRDAVNTDYTIVDAPFKDAVNYLHDEQRVITRDLYLQFYAISEGSAIETDINWYILLEEVDITPTESIMQAVKGIAQNVG
ncbi:MAG: hypothetical protein ACTSQH_08400 [Candidatus Hodarchaeales archaeon]